MKLRNKINLSTAVLFIGLFIVMNFFIYFLFSNLMINSEKEQVKAEAEKIVEAFHLSLGTIPDDKLILAYTPVDGMIQIVAEGQVEPLHSVISPPSEKELGDRQVQYYHEEKSATISFAGSNYSFESIPIIWTDGRVVNMQLTQNIQTAVDNVDILRIVLITVTMIATIPVLVSSLLLSKLITGPITSMIATMAEIRKSGNFKRIKIANKSNDELHEMGITFNHMMDLLESNFEKQEQFIANASHELRTPLTVIESYASLLKRRGVEDRSIFNESIEAIHSEAIRMQDMTEQLLLLAKQHEQWKMNPERLNLGPHLQQTVLAFEKAFRREIYFQKAAENIIIFADAQKLKQLTYILLENAKKYSDAAIIVKVGEIKDYAYIEIRDKGIGIPKKDLHKVFDRFYRVDKARSRMQGGSGLGLTMAKEIATAMNARLMLESEEGSGTTVTIFLHKIT
ncbi:HAMP domain-containing histidine kinase [Bacillaceae bacterium Marseille-Q3522]|nr:HAMP domain-containing histidine kinase [Bacillaceae bacterium Marseille-Q3522]